jgi:hypothetical protein
MPSDLPLGLLAPALLPWPPADLLSALPLAHPAPLPRPARPPPCLQSFWSRLAGRYGTKFYWQEEGQDVAIVNAVAAIDNCVREPMGRGQCSSIKGELE